MDLISGTTSSEKQHEKSVLSRISSLTKGVSSMSAERTHSLPVIPVADSATSSSEEYIIDMSNMDVSFLYLLLHTWSCSKSTSGKWRITLFSQVRVLVSVSVKVY